ncbi:MAG: 2-oxo acid dehydrogenase subunit E2 [Ruminococcaceae bacterium]|nr:2-oxo acid dehydrogenase subunit E2 [Oscillospiraceae bacterium]
MAKPVIMPKAGITVESCIIGKWQKNVGDMVKVGDILFTYETDKAAFECESTEEGELLEIFYGDGEEVPCLVNVCAVGTKGDDVSALRPASGAAPAEAAEAAAPAVEEKKEESATAPAASASAPSADGLVRISPRAKGLAERSGVNYEGRTGTGPKGRIIEQDIRRFMLDKGAEAEEAAVAAPAAAASVPTPEFEDVKFSGIRRAISKSMIRSLSEAAQLTNHHTFDATAIQSYRAALKAAGDEYAGVTIGDMVLYAVSRTLLNHPDLNANMIGDDTIRHFKHVNLGVAVDTPRGLMVPTIFNADEKSLLEISREVKTLAEAARSGSISPDLLSGGSFTVSNLGSMGVEVFTPVINPPQTGILGVCTITQRVKEVGGEMKIYPAMGLSLTYDHRAVDGAPAARFMKELCANLEKITVLLAK